jgi:hypothetical protein
MAQNRRRPDRPSCPLLSEERTWRRSSPELRRRQQRPRRVRKLVAAHAPAAALTTGRYGFTTPWRPAAARRASPVEKKPRGGSIDSIGGGGYADGRGSKANSKSAIAISRRINSARSACDASWPRSASHFKAAAPDSARSANAASRFLRVGGRTSNGLGGGVGVVTLISLIATADRSDRIPDRCRVCS